MITVIVTNVITQFSVGLKFTQKAKIMELEMSEIAAWG